MPRKPSSRGPSAWSLAAALFCLGTATVSAQEAAPPPEAPKKWESTAAAAITLTSGNSDSFMATVTLDTKRKWTRDEAAFGLAAGYGEHEVNDVTEKNAEFIQGFGQYNRLFTERLYGGVRVDGQYDGIAGVDYRFKISPLVGYYLIKNEKTSLAVEAGPSLILENLESEPSHAYWAARVGERFEHKLTPTTRIWQSLDYIPQVDRWAEKYLITGEIGIDTSITKRWTLRVVFQDIYDSQPATDRERNDIRLMAGTAYKF